MSAPVAPVDVDSKQHSSDPLPLPSDPALRKSLLSDRAILHHLKEGSVVIHPFNRESLSTSSYDVTLGRYYFRESDPECGLGVYNPYSSTHVSRVWGIPREAERHSEWMKRTGNAALENIAEDDYIIWLKPGETILGHTNEFLGGRKSVTTMMKARSSMGRNFIEVCKCAGWGDVGYIYRWTMEITNNSRYYSIPLVVGRRIAQIVFFDSDGIVSDHGSYESKGKYQTTNDLQLLIKQWKPQDMLPRMYLDREIERKNVEETETEAPAKTTSQQ